MGMNTALKNKQIPENAWGILGIESTAAAQALDMRGHKPCKGVTAAREVIRRYVDYLGEDRPLFSDHTKTADLVRSCEILEAVETEVGTLN